MASPEEAAQREQQVREAVDAIRPPLESPYQHQHHLDAVRDALAEMRPQTPTAGMALDVQELQDWMPRVMGPGTRAEQLEVLSRARQEIDDHITVTFLERWHRLIANEVWPPPGDARSRHYSAVERSSESSADTLQSTGVIEPGPIDAGPMTHSPEEMSQQSTPEPPPIDQRVTRSMARRLTTQP